MVSLLSGAGGACRAVDEREAAERWISQPEVFGQCVLADSAVAATYAAIRTVRYHSGDRDISFDDIVLTADTAIAERFAELVARMMMHGRTFPERKRCCDRCRCHRPVMDCRRERLPSVCQLTASFDGLYRDQQGRLRLDDRIGRGRRVLRIADAVATAKCVANKLLQ